MGLHSHYDPTEHRFVEHQHIHLGARPHVHVVVATSSGLRELAVPSFSNYSPHGLAGSPVAECAAIPCPWEADNEGDPPS